LQRRGLIAESIEVAEGTMTLAKEVGDPMRIAQAHRALGIGYSLCGRIPEARMEIEAGVRIMRTLDDKPRLANALGALGEVDRLEGRISQARASYEEALALLRNAGDLDGLSIMLLNLAMVAIDAGEVEGARGRLREAASISEKIKGKYIGTAAVTIAGALAAASGDSQRAPHFWGAAAEARERMGVLLDPPDAMFLEPHVARVRAELGAAAFETAERGGRAVPHESALAEVRAWLEGSRGG
ncbi:MAG: tetratricopeptide repeat protein, partial [Hyphomicrobiales bacterium]